uniref:Uncharacterized protein n=1 Tax=Arundo donax TaxID=35708 RepID=A0A0A9D337_ARUDO
MKVYIEHGCWFSQNIRACQKNKNIQTYCSRQMDRMGTLCHMINYKYRWTCQGALSIFTQVWNSLVFYLNSRLLTGGASPGMSRISLLCGFTI